MTTRGGVIGGQRPKDLGAMSPDDIKKIMAKGNRKSRRKGDKLKGSDE
jgi:hypothetical protein